MATTVQIPRRLEAEEDRRASVVSVENVYKSFGAQTVLNGVSLNVGRGETLAVLGPQRYRKERTAEAHHWPENA